MIDFSSSNLKTWSKLGQRGSLFGSAIFKIVENNANVIILTADLGYLSGLDRFVAQYPNRFINTGIAEQNLVGVSAALSMEGFIPFATTYATFITMRSCEQIRHFLGYMGCNVKLVGSGAGLIMGFSGNTHYTFEDIAIIRSIPNITIFSPADAAETVKIAIASVELVGPVYIRLTGGLSNPMVYNNDYNFEIGKAVVLRDTGNVTIFATGSMVYYALKAADLLIEFNIFVRIVNIHTIKPLDNSVIEESALNSQLLVSVEEHSIIGGLGGAISEYLCTLDSHPRLLKLGIADKYGLAGDYEYLLRENGLTPDLIAEKIKKTLV
jgi:transketolase